MTTSGEDSGKRLRFVWSGVSAYYGRHRVLESVDGFAAPGEITAVFGHNGAGKSTLLRAINRELVRQAGAAFFETDGNRSIVKPRIRRIPQDDIVFPGLTVRENLLMGSWDRKSTRRELEGRLGEIESLFPRLTVVRRAYGGTLSGGERRMVALGMALLGEPNVLLIDEPSIGLAPVLVAEVIERIGMLARERNICVVMVEQNIRAVSSAVSRFYVLRQGQIVREGVGDELRDASARELYGLV